MGVVRLSQHQSIVLRAETPAEMLQWWRRLKSCSEGPGSLRQLPARAASPPPDGGGKKGGKVIEPSLDNYGGAGGNGGYGVRARTAFLACNSCGIGERSMCTGVGRAGKPTVVCQRLYCCQGVGFY